MKRHSKSGFTLVELLVVIGIIALLISILLPALNKAREAANTIKCSSNLRSIGQGIANYLANYNSAFPASNFYVGLTISGGPYGVQTPATPTSGYVHWSSYLYGSRTLDQGDQAYFNTQGWQMFMCPSLINGGVPPANTYSGNNDGLANEAGPGVIDLQAPRMSYMLNEAPTPRSIFVIGFRVRRAITSSSVPPKSPARPIRSWPPKCGASNRSWNLRPTSVARHPSATAAGR